MATDKQKKPGPDPERLKLDEDDWEDAVEKSFGKGKPPPGWEDEPIPPERRPKPDSDGEDEG